jgi:hypothetical protein
MSTCRNCGATVRPTWVFGLFAPPATPREWGLLDHRGLPPRELDILCRLDDLGAIDLIAMLNS